ncbi:MAG: HAD-IB family phosphatase [Pseudomonadota bacterium]|nr:HAD-IB family phosphatase [Pseudomonadota bacterium]
MTTKATPAWAVLCDFDGTIAQEDVTDSLLMRFGRPGWDVLEVDWREGRIGSRECMAGQIALLDCNRDELDEHLAAMTIDPDFARFAAAVERAGATLTIVSDGLDYAIRSILRRHGLTGLPIIASHLVPVSSRRWTLEFPFSAPDCTSASGTCKCAWAGEPRVGPGTWVLMVGDGASDFCVARRADLTFASKRLLDFCLDHDLAHRAVANFGQALASWSELSAAQNGSQNSSMSRQSPKP